MRVVAFPGDILDSDVVAQAQSGVVVDETGEHPVLEHLTRELVAEVLSRPAVMALIRVVGPLEPVGNPSDAALGQGELHVGELAQHG